MCACSKFDHLNRVIAELKRTKSRKSSCVDTTLPAAAGHSRLMHDVEGYLTHQYCCYMLVIPLFVKQESQLVTYATGPVKSTVDYIIVRQEDKAKVRNVKVIPNEECLPKHKLLVMNMQFSTRKRWHKKFETRVHVWKLKEEKTCQEYQNMVKDKVAEAEWKYSDVNEHWQQMKNIMMDTAQVTCGLSKGPCRHKKHSGGMRKLLKQ